MTRRLATASSGGVGVGRAVEDRRREARRLDRVRVGRLEGQRLGRRARPVDRHRRVTKTSVGRSGGMLNGMPIEIRPLSP